MRIKIDQNEFWYGGCVAWGAQMPLGAASSAHLVLEPNPTPNQGMPLLVSSQGRWLWLDGVREIEVEHGCMECSGPAVLQKSGETLRSAYQAAMAAHFPFDGRRPAAGLFAAPIFNTWIELTFNQNQQDILRYAHSILKNGFEPGVLMIDDGWAESYGSWRFHTGRFPDPRGMLQELHSLGFQVMLWLCPYVTPDGEAFREARDRGLLLENAEGKPFLVDWWNGYSAGLDLLNPAAPAWLKAQLAALEALGVDGFKFDGGDAQHYVGAFGRQGGARPNEMARQWALFGEKYPFNEYRAAWGAAGLPLLQRLCDKDHSWGESGLAALIPDTLAQGITGHPFGCPDMVGGGEYLNFRQNAGRLDGELFVKHAGVGCLMPAIQFSAAPWRVLTPAQNQALHRQLELRAHYRAELELALMQAARTGEPAVRYMEYEFPHQGLEQVRDQFMLGSRLLVAPVLEKGACGRQVHLPAGRWRFAGQSFECRGELRAFRCPDTLVVVLERVEA